MRTARSVGQLKSVKYKLLGILPPPKNAHEYPSIESWTETDTLQYLRQTRVLAQSIIRQLSQMTDLLQPPVRFPDIRSSLSSDTDVKRLLKNFGGLGPLADEIRTAGSLVSQLTKFDYGPQRTEMISHLLYSALRHNRALFWDCATFNHVIGYFLATNDLQMAFYTLKEMKTRGIKPDRITLHLLLKFQARRVMQNPYPVGAVGHPLISTQHALQTMDKAGVRADTTTWNLVLQCMPFGFGKSFLVEEMDRRGITLDSSSRRNILQAVIEDRAAVSSTQTSSNSNNQLIDNGRGSSGAPAAANSMEPSKTTTDIPQMLLEALDPSDSEVLQVLVDYMLTRKSADNGNVRYAWRLMQSSDVPASKVQSTAMLNIWLRRLAARRHLDWQFGILGFFERTPWNPESWQYLLEAAAFCTEQPEKYLVLGTLLKQAEREDVPLTSRARYVVRRALRRCPKEYELRDLGATGFETLKSGLRWTEVFEYENPSLLGIIGFASQEKPALHLESEPVRHLDEVRYSAVPKTNDGARREQELQYLQLQA